MARLNTYDEDVALSGDEILLGSDRGIAQNYKLSKIAEYILGLKSQGVNEDNYIFHQSLPSSTWTIPHTLNKTPSVTIYTSAGDVVEGSIQYIGTTKVIINFNSSFSGYVTLN